METIHPNQTKGDNTSGGFRFALWVARRYLFSRKSHNAINIISGIAALGVGIGTMALICVLSVFNGFDSLIQGMFSAFDPDLKITVSQGKTFDINTPEWEKVKKLNDVA
jgi:lipoprotein-releasing system permease protein